MRLVVLNCVTLDGFFQGTRAWDVPVPELASEADVKRIMAEQTGRAEALLLGRLTYEAFASFWPTQRGTRYYPSTARFVNKMPKYVVSSTLSRGPWGPATILRGNLVKEVKKLRSKMGGEVLVLGSGRLVAALDRARLVDEYRLFIAPQMFRRGRLMLPPPGPRLRLRLLEARALRSGMLFARYEPLHQRVARSRSGRRQ